jgi:hypothetical protein
MVGFDNANIAKTPVEYGGLEEGPGRHGTARKNGAIEASSG